jgi:hypothetical protein
VAPVENLTKHKLFDIFKYSKRFGVTKPKHLPLLDQEECE